MNPISIDTANTLLDFSGGDTELTNLAIMQSEGAVALYNALIDQEVGLGYLADEVGMGKTYIALGVVALMRYFKPSLRVLYICPSRNVQEKWEKDYKAFIRSNVKVSQGRIRTRDGKPAAPYCICENVNDLLNHASSGYYADFFVRKDSFSIALSYEESADWTDEYIKKKAEAAWQKKLDELIKLVPAKNNDLNLKALLDPTDSIQKQKQQVKIQYANVLNYMLPDFDLIVIDEAHNFKHDFESSDRNMVLSRILGVNSEKSEGSLKKRIDKALLLSATPYDRNITQLVNQLKLVGKEHLLGDIQANNDKDKSKSLLQKFMVRRLNKLHFNKITHTRNMYRREWRKGDQAEITLQDDAQKLIMALVQKKVGEVLGKDKDNPSFQTGLLASFESFADSAGAGSVQFDGQETERDQQDAADKHLIRQLVRSYDVAGFGKTLPHPKMDSVVEKLKQEMFEKNKKQLVFVRRVKSVSELKDKLDDVYNEWLSNYFAQELTDYSEASDYLKTTYDRYLDQSKKRDVDHLEYEVQIKIDDSNEKKLPPKNNNFFAAFFRGKPLEGILSESSVSAKWPTPDRVSTSLNQKNNSNSILLEPNWVRFIEKKVEGISISSDIDKFGEEILSKVRQYLTSSDNKTSDGSLEYRACQAGYLAWLATQDGYGYVSKIVPPIPTKESDTEYKTLSLGDLKTWLNYKTYFCYVDEYDLQEELNPWQEKAFKWLSKSGNEKNGLTCLELFEVHVALNSYLLRNGHGLIDLFIARLKVEKSLNEGSRQKWIKHLVNTLKNQKLNKAFSTFHELHRVATHLELIIKTNLSDIHEKSRSEYKTYISRSLTILGPVVGASGETQGRSSTARSFRMPGYPLALISTDVFQEGEDLHTFCDSITHYGVSYSPISLEQKTGRVDRVNSMAQRRLLEFKDAAPSVHDYIQVSFPFVKQSIEFLQIRQVCSNLNEYLTTLHDFESKGVAKNKDIPLNEALNDSSSIPDQIMEKLSSPYEELIKKIECIQSVEINKLIGDRSEQRTHIIKHITDLVTRLPEFKSIETLPAGVDFDLIDKGNRQVTLVSAKASGELLLSITSKMEAEFTKETYGDCDKLLRYMNDHCWNTFYRTLAIPSSNENKYNLYTNAELLVGDENRTQVDELNMLMNRFDINHQAGNYQKPISKSLLQLFDLGSDLALLRSNIEIDRSGKTSYKIVETLYSYEFHFNFGQETNPREHVVNVYEHDGRCILLSVIASKDHSGWQKCISDPQLLVRFTWIRNRQIDLVEFVVNPDKELVGRIVHPIKNMGADELLYCAYTLAVESDNLEYIMNQEDLIKFS